MSLPAVGTFDVPGSGVSFTNEDFASAQGAFLEAVRAMIGAAAPSYTTISSGSITPSVACNEVDTEGAAASDDLTRINYDNLADGSILLLWPANASRVVTVKHTFTASYSGRMRLQSESDHIMDSASKCIMLQRRGSVWYEIMRMGGVSPEHGSAFFSASGTWTVPTGVTQCYVTLIPGGGGGGGGGATTLDGANVDGSTGSPGGMSSFHNHLSATGGAGGTRGFSKFGGYADSLGMSSGQNPYSTIGGHGGQPGTTPLGIYGRGGAGGNGANSSSYVGAGGGASGGIGTGLYIKSKVTGLVAGTVKNITIGAGGAGGAGGVGNDRNGSAGQSGADGAVLIEW